MNSTPAAIPDRYKPFMKVFSIQVLLFLFLQILLLNSCKSKLTHKEASEYYNAVNNIVDKVTHESSQYIIDQMPIEGEIMNSITKSMLNDPPIHLDTFKIEVYKKRYQQFKIYLDSLKITLSAIKETDKTINLQRNAIEYINKQLDFHTEAFQNNIKTYSDYASTSEGENENSRSISLKVLKENLDRSTNDLIESSTQYAIKYGIRLRKTERNGL
jgi:hypothetical protein